MIGIVVPFWNSNYGIESYRVRCRIVLEMRGYE